MVTTRAKTAVYLSFEVVRPRGMSMTRGNNGIGERDCSRLSFSILPPWSSTQQTIWLMTDESKVTRRADPGLLYSKEPRRRLTKDISGSLVLRSPPTSSATGHEQVDVTRTLILDADVKRNDTPDNTEDGLGTLTYFPGSTYGIEEGYSIELQLTEQEFSVVQALFAVGKHPLGVSIATPDLQYGRASDGSDKEWDIVDCPYAKITGFELDMSVDDPRVLVGPKRDESEVAEEAQREQVARGAVVDTWQNVQLVAQRLAGIALLINQMRAQLGILILLSVASLVFLALLYFQK